MSKIIAQFETEQAEKLMAGKEIPTFAPGDTVSESVLIKEGKNERIQLFEGLCIARRNRSIHSSFTVRKISHGEGVERTFPLYSTRVAGVKVIRRGIVRRAKLYYMRDLRGKAARIREKMDYSSKKKKA